MKDWEARFKRSERQAIGPSELFSWTAFVIASVYAAFITLLLIGISRDADPESVTAGWIVFGLPWVLAVGRHYWWAIPLNSLTLYFTVAAAILGYRRSLPPTNSK
jgi:hypothetical protein